MLFLLLIGNTSHELCLWQVIFCYLSKPKTYLKGLPMTYELQTSLSFIIELNALKSLFYQFNPDTFMWKLQYETNVKQ